MQYMILCYETPAQFQERDNPATAAAYWGAWSAYVQAIAESGILQSAAGLQPPSTTTTVRLRNGQRQVQDGPYADTKEQLGGFFLIDVPDLDVALAWAARSPSAGYAGAEVRPVLPPMS